MAAASTGTNSGVLSPVWGVFACPLSCVLSGAGAVPLTAKVACTWPSLYTRVRVCCPGGRVFR